jgi:hypothetical protein
MLNFIKIITELTNLRSSANELVTLKNVASTEEFNSMLNRLDNSVNQIENLLSDQFGKEPGIMSAMAELKFNIETLRRGNGDAAETISPLQTLDQ